MKCIRYLQPFTLMLLTCALSMDLSAQATVDETNAGRYYMEGKRLSVKELNILFTAPETAAHWSKALKNRRVENVFGTLSIAGLSWFAGYQVAQLLPAKQKKHPSQTPRTPQQVQNVKNAAYVVLASSIGCIGLTAIFDSKYDFHSHKAAVEYNKLLKDKTQTGSYIEIKGGANGLGLCYTF